MALNSAEDARRLWNLGPLDLQCSSGLYAGSPRVSKGIPCSGDRWVGICQSEELVCQLYCVRRMPIKAETAAGLVSFIATQVRPSIPVSS
jgi:hypothetical protein